MFLSVVIPAIAGVLGVRESGSQPPMEELKDDLHDKQMLLVLDNFEQIVRAAPLIGELLAAAPKLKIMTTSREVLHVYGEHDYAVPPLGLPDPKRRQTVAVLSQYEAVALFIQRAKAAKPTFEITDDNAPAVAEICVRLDGLPLAIELAAARSRLLTPQAMLERLSSRLTALTGGARDLPKRQQTIRATIDWSYDLLDEGEKSLFARLAVFSGGWTLEGAGAVCAEGLPFDVLDGLESLLDKSLIRQGEGESGEPRFTMLETIREYAAEKMEQSGEAATIRARHAEFLASLAERAEPALQHGGEQQVWIKRLDDEQDNLRAAMGWALGSSAVEVAMRIGAPLWRYYLMRLAVSEFIRWLEQALALKASAPPGLRAKTLRAYVSSMLESGTGTDSMIDHLNALQEEALGLYRQVGDQEGIAAILNNLAVSAQIRGDYARSNALLEEALALHRAQGYEVGIGIALSNLGWIAAMEERFEEAYSITLESQEFFTRLNNASQVAWGLAGMGVIKAWAGDIPHARQHLEESLAIFSAQQHESNAAWDSMWLGLVSLLECDFQRARSELRECLRVLIELPESARPLQLIALNLLWLGGAVSPGEPARAACLLGAGMRLRPESWPPDTAIAERLIAETRARLAPEVFDAAWAEGQAMSLEEAIAFALEDLP